MRIPCVRKGNDDSPFEWWEWLCWPFVTVIFLTGLLILAVGSIPVAPILRVARNMREKKLLSSLPARGRAEEWASVQKKLELGEGTLIIEHLSVRGPIREWWTDDDVILSSPVPLPQTIKKLPEGDEKEKLAAYGKMCAAKYTDLATGQAKLTKVPVPLLIQIDPRKCVTVDLGDGAMTSIPLPTGRNLAARYPKGKIVTFIAWGDPPLIALGDAEAVFLARLDSKKNRNLPLQDQT